VSLYQANSGPASSGALPAFGSTVTMNSNKLSGDTYVFDELSNNFKYLVSDTLYTDIGVLSTLLNTATPILNPNTGVYSSSFTYTNPTFKRYLYLVWDYRKTYEILLCFDETSPEIACDCSAPFVCVEYQAINNLLTTAEIAYINCSGIRDTIVVPAETSVLFCGYEIVTNFDDITIIEEGPCAV